MRTAVVNFNSGEMTPKVDARADTEKYAGGCRQSDNMLPSQFGGSEKRPGTEFITSDGTFNTILAAIVADGNVEVILDGSLVVTGFDNMLSRIICIEPTVDAWATSTVYAIDDYRTETGLYYRCAVAHTSGTFATDLAAGKWALNAYNLTSIICYENEIVSSKHMAFTNRVIYHDNNVMFYENEVVYT